MDKYVIGDADTELKKIDSSSIKFIYIDPPYNTGSKFHYNDKRERLAWQKFMEDKLAESRRIMTEDGVIFISIDDNEYVRLDNICERIFGENNRIGTMITRQATRSNSKHINIIHEYIVCFAKDKTKLERFEVPRLNLPTYEKAIKKIKREVKSILKKSGKEKAQSHLNTLLKHYQHIDGFEWIRNYNQIDDKGRIFFPRDLSTPSKPHSLKIPEINLDLPALKTRGWMSREKFIELHNQDRLHFKKGRPYKKVYIEESKDSLMSMLNFYSRQGTHDLERLGLKGLFDTPKPVEMIKLLIKASCQGNETILDYFSGSATTGQAVWEINQELGYNLSFILIQLPEPVDPDSQAGMLLSKHGLKPNIANAGILRLQKVKERYHNRDFTIINPVY